MSSLDPYPSCYGRPGLLLALGLSLLGCHGTAPRLAIVGNADACRAARLAAADANSSGGIRGRTLELEVLEEAPAVSMTEVALRAQKLASDARVLAVVGHSGSAASLAAAGIYNAARVTQLAPTTTSPLFERAGPYSFSLVPDDNGQVAFLAGRVGRDPAARVALVYGNDDYGREIAIGLRRRLHARGVHVVFEAPYDPRSSAEEMGVLGASIGLHRPTALFWLGGVDALKQVLPQLEAALPRLRVLGSDSFDSPTTYANADGMLTGLRFVRFADPGEGPGMASLRARFRAATGGDLTDEAVLAYDAVSVLAAALRAGASTREEVREYLLSLGRERPAFQGLAGPIWFGARPAVHRGYRLAEVTAHGVVIVHDSAGGSGT